ncbi:hypothetical protein DFH08DRAFT_917901 [Mycena albidolilacea]|uniref:TRI14-like protein n=1 Tax=Mycena albidolilacea TaxID=1033008 RepID=A0AAD6ZA38_9AGAR|nr:hypothetical protein DFH08DRAFT_917901 [Mycena albidolilacea]
MCPTCPFLTTLLALVRSPSLPLHSLPGTGSTCPPFNSSTFVINQFQLYPENGKFDFQRCVVYFGALFNASVAVFDPYTNTVTESITFPGLTGDPSLHLGPALPDGAGGLTVLLDAAAAFNTNGADVSGGNILIKYDLDTKAVRWQRNLTAKVTQGRYGGFQDVEHDRDLNVYVVGTFPGTVLRSDKNGENLAEWYVPPAAQLANTTVAGFAGLAAIPGRDLLLTNNNADGEVYRFDGISTSTTGTPVKVKRTAADGTTAATSPLGFSDAISLPARYNGTVLLLAEDAVGVTVLRSRDGTWRSAETLGTVSNNVTAAQGGMVPAAVQIGAKKIFAVQEFFADTPLVAGTNAGNRTAFPMVDITAEVDKLLTQAA